MNSKKSLVEKPKAKPKATKKVLVEKPKAKPKATKKVSVEKPKAKPKATKKVSVEKPNAKPKATKKVLVEKPKAKPKATKKVLVEKPKATKKGGGYFSSPLSKVINEFKNNSESLYDAYDKLTSFLNDIEDYTNVDEDEKKIILKLLNNHLNDDLNVKFEYENITFIEYNKILKSNTFKSIIPYINLIELSNKIYKSIQNILDLSEDKDKEKLLLILNNTYNDPNKDARTEQISNIKKKKNLLLQTVTTHLQSDSIAIANPNTSGFDTSGTSDIIRQAHAPNHPSSLGYTQLT